METSERKYLRWLLRFRAPAAPRSTGQKTQAQSTVKRESGADHAHESVLHRLWLLYCLISYQIVRYRLLMVAAWRVTTGHGPAQQKGQHLRIWDGRQNGTILVL